MRAAQVHHQRANVLRMHTHGDPWVRSARQLATQAATGSRCHVPQKNRKTSAWRRLPKPMPR